MTKSEPSTGLGVVGVAGVDGATARWLPIECADKTITNVQDFSEIGIILCNSDRYWVRDDDGRVYEASWTDDKAGYWWDWEGESQVDPVQFMPHPLDPRFSSPSMTPTTHPATDVGLDFGSQTSATAMFDVIAERLRQQEKEGWTPEHDDTHFRGELARAAACYALQAAQRADETPYADLDGRRRWRRTGLAIRRFWPWGWGWWKPLDARRDLIRAAALIIAEIERLDRAALTTPEDQQ